MEPTRTLLAFVLALETSLFAAPLSSASAEVPSAPPPPRASLHWVRAPSAQDCIDGRELARRVESKLHRPVFEAPRDAQLIVEGSAVREGKTLRAELRTFDAQGKALGSREVVSERASCEELSETVAVVLAVMIDPAGALAPPPSGGVTEPAPTEPAPPKPSEASEPTPAAVCPAPPPAPPPWEPTPNPKPAAHVPTRADVSAFIRADWGHLPKPLLGGGVALELRVGRWGGMRFEGSVFAERTVDADEPPDTGADVRVLYAGAAYCPLWGERGRVRTSGCAGLAAGAMQSQGFGFNKENQSVSPLVDATLDLRGAVRLWKALGFYWGAGLMVPLVRTTLQATLPDRTHVTVLEQPPLAGRIDLGLGARF
ncbi:MAG: hypothetical protein QM778_35705 [Myxococcales bacterium]